MCETRWVICVMCVVCHVRVRVRVAMRAGVRVRVRACVRVCVSPKSVMVQYTAINHSLPGALTGPVAAATESRSSCARGCGFRLDVGQAVTSHIAVSQVHNNDSLRPPHVQQQSVLSCYVSPPMHVSLSVFSCRLLPVLSMSRRRRTQAELCGLLFGLLVV